MLKNFLRTFLILTAAGLISLGWYAFSTTAVSSQAMPLERPADFTQTDEAANDQIPADEMSESRPPRPGGEDMGFSLLRLLAGMVGKMVITAVVVALVVLLRRLISRFTPTRFKFV